MAEEDKVFSKCAWRLIPFMGLLYLAAHIDRTNAGLAALTMNKDLGFSPTVFGFGAGIFFMGYAIFQVPANVMLERIGARLNVLIAAPCSAVQTNLAQRWRSSRTCGRETHFHVPAGHGRQVTGSKPTAASRRSFDGMTRGPEIGCPVLAQSGCRADWGRMTACDPRRIFRTDNFRAPFSGRFDQTGRPASRAAV